jgi:hypothetical protein
MDEKGRMEETENEGRGRVGGCFPPPWRLLSPERVFRSITLVYRALQMCYSLS